MIYIPAVLALSSFALAGWTSKTGESFHKNAVYTYSDEIQAPVTQVRTHLNIRRYLTFEGEISCCNTSKSSEESTGEQDSLLSLGNILDQVALDCVQIPILAVAIEDECKNTPVCCEDTDQGGLIGISCSPLPLI
ncbi:hypothetical protein E3Q11_00352 [Wallemia mellicola]|nr:hypothetical protein E3Q11_00352 [Wallemia mellicola]